jgi:two-component system, OmpR family, sensor histidine kinase KdpD
MAARNADSRLGAAFAGFLALVVSIVIGVVFAPFRETVGLENLAILYMAVVAVAAVAGGRLGGFIAAVAAALSYNWFFTTPYGTLQIDSAEQVITVLLLFLGGVVASLAGDIQRRLLRRRVRAATRDDEQSVDLLHSVLDARARGEDSAHVAVTELLPVLHARWVAILPAAGPASAARAAAGDAPADLDVAALPSLDRDALLSGDERASLPAQGFVLPLGQGTVLAAVPARPHPLSRPVRVALLSLAEILTEPSPTRAPGQ